MTGNPNDPDDDPLNIPPAEDEPALHPVPEDESTLVLPDTGAPEPAPPFLDEPVADIETERTAPASDRDDVAVAPPVSPPARRISFRDVLVAVGSGVLGGGVTLLLLYIAQLMLAGTFESMEPALQATVVVALLGGIAFFVGMALGIWQRMLGFVAALIAGLVIALAMYLFWQSYNGQAVEGLYSLLHGLPGMLTGLGLSALGGWVGMQIRVALSAPPAHAVPAKVGVAASVLWVIGEIVAWATTRLTFPPAAQATLAPAVLTPAVAYPVLTAAALFVGYRAGIRKEDWHYRWSGLSAATGGIVGLILFAVTWFLTRQIDMALFGAMATSVMTTLEGAISASPAGWKVAYLAVVGLLVPVTEEWVWRGIVQTGLTRGMGQVTGFIVTALLYVLKYIVIALSLANLTTLLVLAIVLGLVRMRVGTAASTVTHMVNNLLTALLVLL